MTTTMTQNQNILTFSIKYLFATAIFSNPTFPVLELVDKIHAGICIYDTPAPHSVK